MPEFFDDRRPHNGLSYEEYRDQWRARKEADLDDPDPSERRMHHYLNYNWDRQADVHASYNPSDALQAALAAIDDPQLWMVLTEPWCGDSAFLFPVVAEAASQSEMVTLRILPRDDNLDIMDQYLTGGSRSIPKLVAFTEDGDELFTWGPRPQDVAQQYEELSEKHDDKMDVVAELLEYYEDGNWKKADEELAEVIQTTVSASSPAP